MSKSFDRILTALACEEPDRVPIGLWGSWYHKLIGVSFEEANKQGDTMAKSHLAFFKRFSIDFLKITPDAWCMAEDWGTKTVFDETTANVRAKKFALQNPAQWEELKPLDPTKNSRLSEQLRCIKILTKSLQNRIPIIYTIFTPFTIAAKLMGSYKVLKQMKAEPEKLEIGLEVITDTTREFCNACLEAGIDGIFHAVSMSAKQQISKEDFKKFVLRYDLKVLDSVKHTPIRILHIHTLESGHEPWMEEFEKYPVNGINWWEKGTRLPMTTMKTRYKNRFCLVGGLDRGGNIVKGTPREVAIEAKSAIDAGSTSGGFILAPSCTVPITAPYENLDAAIYACMKYGRYPMSKHN